MEQQVGFPRRKGFQCPCCDVKSSHREVTCKIHRHVYNNLPEYTKQGINDRVKAYVNGEITHETVEDYLDLVFNGKRISGYELIGVEITKEFNVPDDIDYDYDTAFYDGVVMTYNTEDKTWRVVYEDDDSEDMDIFELMEYVVDYDKHRVSRFLKSFVNRFSGDRD